MSNTPGENEKTGQYSRIAIRTEQHSLNLGYQKRPYEILFCLKPLREKSDISHWIQNERTRQNLAIKKNKHRLAQGKNRRQINFQIKNLKEMKTKIKILKVRDGSFQGREGDTIEYSWVKAERLSDNVTFEFGTKKMTYEAGEEAEPEFEKTEDGKGGFRYKEIGI
jgi:hypothetical protein